ncbi:hypothetical protein HZS_4370 [Henneguya salminicola]|nr:hypothetical protein HZS_4370 [Henneguya salminicola]
MLLDEEVQTMTKKERNSFIEYLLIPVAFFIQFFLFGLLNNIGTIKYYWDNHPISSSILLENAGSVNFGFIYLSAILGFYLIDYIGPSFTYALGAFLVAVSIGIVATVPNPVVIFLFYGMILGFAASLILFSLLYVIKDTFAENLSIVNGIVACGSCVGTMVQSVFIDKLCNHFGWVMVFRVYGILFLIMILFAFVLEKAYNEYKSKSKNKAVSKTINENLIVFLVMKNTKYIILCVSTFVVSLGYLVIYLYIQIYAHSNGVEANKARTLIGYFSIGSLFGRLFFGFVANFIGSRRINVLILCFFVMGLLNILSTFCNSFVGFLIYCIVLGIFDGGFISLLFPVICDMFSKLQRGHVYENKLEINDDSDQQNMATAICYFLQGISLMIGPIITNILIDKVTGISTAFIFSGLLFITSSLILALTYFV